MSKDPSIYLDYNATSPLRPEVKAGLGDWADRFGNPSSAHVRGREAREAIERARGSLAELIGAESEERLVFTSGATESISLAFRSIGRLVPERQRKIIVGAIEHPAVLRNAERLASNEGFAISYLPVNAQGLYDIEAARKLIDESTGLVSIMLVNNETGVIEPIEAISQICREKGVLLHLDAVQGLGRVPIDVLTLGVDFLTLSAHKVGGLKGAGLLYALSGIALDPLVMGGGQERKLRGGTENTLGILAFEAAAKAVCQKIESENQRLSALREAFVKALKVTIPDLVEHGEAAPRVGNTACLSFLGCEGHALVNALDAAGVQCSAGSACASGTITPSPVLLAMGVDRQLATAAVRFSMGFGTTLDEVAAAAKIVANCVSSLRCAT